MKSYTNFCFGYFYVFIYLIDSKIVEYDYKCFGEVYRLTYYVRTLVLPNKGIGKHKTEIILHDLVNSTSSSKLFCFLEFL